MKSFGHMLLIYLGTSFAPAFADHDGDVRDCVQREARTLLRKNYSEFAVIESIQQSRWSMLVFGGNSGTIYWYNFTARARTGEVLTGLIRMRIPSRLDLMNDVQKVRLCHAQTRSLGGVSPYLIVYDRTGAEVYREENDIMDTLPD